MWAHTNNGLLALSARMARRQVPLKPGQGQLDVRHVALIDRGSRLSSNQACMLWWLGVAMTIRYQSRDPDRSVDIIFRAAVNGASCWARNHRGHVRELPMTRWIGGLDAAPHDQLADAHVLGHCSGRPTLDLGCGPGRFTAALRARGSAALGVDNSAVAVELTRRRGGAAVRRDLFAPLPAEGSWDQVLLADGNIGIGGDPVRTLRRVAGLLAPGGIVIVEIEPPSTSAGQEMLRWETHRHVGHWFPWARVNAAAIGDVACSAGFLVTNIVDIPPRVIAVLAAVRGRAR